MSLVRVDELEQSISERASSAVINKLFIELERLANRETHDQEWFDTLYEAFNFIKNIETGFTLAKAYALYIIKTNWMDLPYDIRRRYGFEFMFFAQQVTERDVSTINNYLRTAEVWLDKKVTPGHTIGVVDRDVNNKPLTTHHYEEFDPHRIDMSKLLLVNSVASKGQMTDRLWELLQDSHYSCAELTKELKNNPTPASEPASYFYVEGPYLVFKKDLDRSIIAELNWDEYERSEEVKYGIDHLLSILSVKLDEHYLYQAYRKEFITND